MRLASKLILARRSLMPLQSAKEFAQTNCVIQIVLRIRQHCDPDDIQYQSRNLHCSLLSMVENPNGQSALQ
jgi:hypothetical protein